LFNRLIDDLQIVALIIQLDHRFQKLIVICFSNQSTRKNR